MAPHDRRPPGDVLRGRFWVETVLASITGLLAAVTMVWHEWIEALGVDPDSGDGSAEWAIVLALGAVTVVLAVLARMEYRRAAAAST